jgi:hypothetical protein
VPDNLDATGLADVFRLLSDKTRLGFVADPG